MERFPDFFGVVDTLGLQTGNTVLSAYIVDNYPEHANEVITFYTVIINVSFTSPFDPFTHLVRLMLILPPHAALGIYQSLVHILLDRSIR